MDQYTSEIPYGYCHCGCGQKTHVSPNNDKSKGWVKGEPRRYISGHNAALASRLKPKQSIQKRFWSKIAKTKNLDECWEWMPKRDKDGYGRLGVDGKYVQAHRLSYELTYGKITNGLEVLHRCDNPPCCNPKHLFLGTNYDNMIDMEAKGRSKRHFLSPIQVQNIRERYAIGCISQAELAREVGVCRATVFKIIHNKTHKRT